MSGRTNLLIGAGLLVAVLTLGTMSVVLAQGGPGFGAWGPGAMMRGYGPAAGMPMGGAGMMGGNGGMMQWYGPMMGGPGMMQGPMMGQQGYGGMMGAGHMQGNRWADSVGAAAPTASLDEAREAFQGYLDRTGNADLVLDEVMEFEQNFYAVVKERSAGSGAFELVADKQSGAVFLEYGPAMMWNTTYGHMAGSGGMMGQPAAPSGAAAIAPERARELAQQWLDANQPGSSTEPPDAFPGYYTLHVVHEGNVTGMLSVNATSGQVWYHLWHGAFIAEASPE